MHLENTSNTNKIHMTYKHGPFKIKNTLIFYNGKWMIYDLWRRKTKYIMRWTLANNKKTLTLKVYKGKNKARQNLKMEYLEVMWSN